MKLNKIEIGATLKFTEEDGTTTHFKEGDEVICVTKNDERHFGTIMAVGYYDNSEELAININTSDKKDKMKFSSVIVKASDIEYICMNPLADSEDKP